MKTMVKYLIKFVLPFFDILGVPFISISGFILGVFRRIGAENLPVNRELLRKIGVFPICNHYYEPLFKTDSLLCSLDKKRILPGIDLQIEKQLKLLSNFNYCEELNTIQYNTNTISYSFSNTSFGPGDSEILYSIIRYFKPRHIIEIGSGYSTLMAINAIQKNHEEMDNYSCEHICIEPYERLWLKSCPVKLIRQKLESIDTAFFDILAENDILFIDSSHIIRPQGDVLKEYLEILPNLKSGVLIHIHDMFTPRDYEKKWIYECVRFWNEQYLVEAFLSNNNKFEVLLANNFLSHDYKVEFSEKCPNYALVSDNFEPGSFWIKKI